MRAGLIALAAVVTLLSLAAPAVAQAAGVVPVPVPSTESSTAAVPAQAPVAPVVTAVTQTVETVDPAGAVEAVRTAVSSEPPASAPSPRDGSAPPTRTSSNTANTATPTPSSRGTQQISGVVEEVRRTASRAVAPTIERTTQVAETDALVRSAEETLRHVPLGGEQLANTVGSLSKATEPVRETLTGLLDSFVGSTIAPLFTPGGQAAEAFPPSAFGFPHLTSSTEPASSPYSMLGPLDIPSIESWLEPSMLAFTGLLLQQQHLTSANHDGPGSEQPLTPGRSPVGGPVGAPDDFNAPGPLNVPVPAPESPGAAAPASGGSFFIPFAALLALLALVAPATRRRLSEVPGFLAPTPFVCALERPG